MDERVSEFQQYLRDTYEYALLYVCSFLMGILLEPFLTRAVAQPRREWRPLEWHDRAMRNLEGRPFR